MRNSVAHEQIRTHCCFQTCISCWQVQSFLPIGPLSCCLLNLLRLRLCMPCTIVVVRRCPVRVWLLHGSCGIVDCRCCHFSSLSSLDLSLLLALRCITPQALMYNLSHESPSVSVSRLSSRQALALCVSTNCSLSAHLREREESFTKIPKCSSNVQQRMQAFARVVCSPLATIKVTPLMSCA